MTSTRNPCWLKERSKPSQRSISRSSNLRSGGSPPRTHLFVGRSIVSPARYILKGTSESHLEGKADALKRSGIAFNIGGPQVAFLERVTRKVEHSYTYKKQTGGSGQFAAVTIIVEPNELGKGYEFELMIVGGAVPKEYIPGVEKGLESVLSSGVVAGFPVVDVKVQLIDGKYHDVDSSVLAFEIATRAASAKRCRRRPRCCSNDHESRGNDAARACQTRDRRSSATLRRDRARGRRRHGRCQGDGSARQHVRL